MRRSGSRARWTIGAVGAVVAFGYFVVARRVTEPRNPLGTEHQLLALAPDGGDNPADSRVQLLEAPSGGHWLLCTTAAGGSGLAKPGWGTRVLGMLQAGMDRISARRQWRLHSGEGTWTLEPGGPRRVWRYVAAAWLTDHLVLGTTSAGSFAVLDRKTGRTRIGEPGREWVMAHGIPKEAIGPHQEYYAYTGEESPDPAGALSPGVEGFEGEIPTEFADEHFFGDRRLRLLTVYPFEGGEAAIYAESDHRAPRLLKLVDQARRPHLSQDGRTLLFIRDSALWRLDLHKPLVALLDEAAPPPLPEITVP